MMLNLDDYIIKRKRKKYKFAKFANSDICYEFDEWKKQPIDVIEVGAGTGLFSVEIAKNRPDFSFVAIDVKADRLQTGAYKAKEDNLSNISFLRSRADQIKEVISPKSAAEIWLTFADPFPKKRSAGRRLTHPNFLNLYQTLLRPGGALYIKHDSLEFFKWTLEQLVDQGWKIDELSFDLHESGLDVRYKIMTTYEKRWTEEESKINFVKASKG